MASIFRKDDNYVEQPNRNTVDMSFQNNMTTDFGSLRPCLCMPVLPGESVRIQPTFGLKFLPMQWPVQTRMKASIHFFYVRNRNLWKDWPDFIGKTKEGLVPPYIHLTDQNRKQVETSSLGDFLGIPSVVYGDVITSYSTDGERHYYDYYDNPMNEFSSDMFAADSGSFPAVGTTYAAEFSKKSASETNYVPVYQNVVRYDEFRKSANITVDLSATQILGSMSYKLCLFDAFGSCFYVSDEIRPDTTKTQIVTTFEDYPRELSNDQIDAQPVLIAVVPALALNYITQYGATFESSLNQVTKEKLDVSELPLSELPWRSDDNPKGIPLSALPFRAEESIYTVYYRNAENNPLIINGVPEYNKWLRTNEGGADTNFYPIHYHNWEDDFLTTAVPSPQQGNAPLVGLSGKAIRTMEVRKHQVFLLSPD